MYDVIGIGSAFVDYFFNVDNKTLNKFHLKPEDDFLFQDAKISPEEIFSRLPHLNKSLGGISLNTIAVLGSLGIKVSYCGSIGNDRDGKYFTDNLNKVDKSHLVKIGNMSRCACLLSHNRKHRTFLSEINKEDDKVFNDIDFGYLNNSKFIHVGPFFLDFKRSVRQLEKIFLKINKPLISFSPNIPYAKLGLRLLLPLIKKTHVLFLNIKEIRMLTNENEKKGSRNILKLGPKIVACTIGKKGVLITTKKEQFFVKGIKAKKIIDSTGAGDAFAAGFLYGLIKNKPLRWSTNFANKIAAKSVSDFGLKWLKDIRELNLAQV